MSPDAGDTPMCCRVARLSFEEWPEKEAQKCIVWAKECY